MAVIRSAPTNPARPVTIRLALARCLAVGLTAAWPALSAVAQDQVQPPADMQACEGIFDKIGMPSGVDGADDATYTFKNGFQPPNVPNPHYLYKCYGGGYAVRMNAITKVPDWAAEDLTTAESLGTADRSNNFIDEDHPAGYSSLDKQFEGASFDRGHQVPAGDFSGDQALKDLTFMMSNMGPQVGVCFNRGIWRFLEAAIKDLTRTRGRLIVFTGPLYTSARLRTIAELGTRPDVNVAVPDEFFKIVYAPDDGRVTAMRISNQAHCGASFRSPGFLTSVDAIEEITGFDFFPNLPSRRQEILESQISPFWTW